MHQCKNIYTQILNLFLPLSIYPHKEKLLPYLSSFFHYFSSPSLWSKYSSLYISFPIISLPICYLSLFSFLVEIHLFPYIYLFYFLSLFNSPLSSGYSSFLIIYFFTLLFSLSTYSPYNIPLFISLSLWSRYSCLTFLLFITFLYNQTQEFCKNYPTIFFYVKF